MDINSIVIRLSRKGSNISPYYNITLYGEGRVIFEGINNVKVKGIYEEKIDKNLIINLISKLKNSGFFTIKDTFEVDEAINKEYTIISLSITDENGNNKTKEIIHYTDDESVPKSLIDFENKIDEVVGSKRWVETPIKNTQTSKKENKDFIKEKSEKKPTKKRNNKKIFSIIVGIVIISLIILYMFSQNIITLPINKPENDSDNYLPPKIIFMNVSNNIYFIQEENIGIFGFDDTLYVGYQYSNFTFDKEYRLFEKVEIKKSNQLIDHYSYSRIDNNSEIKSIYNYCNFDISKDWKPGIYTVVFTIVDNNTGLYNSTEESFTLYEHVPKINNLLTVSDVPSYKDYNPKSIFNLSDTVYVYTDYTGINTTNNNLRCDINLTLTVKDIYGNVYIKKSEDKNIVENNSHYWMFYLDENWEKGIYDINLELIDKSNNLNSKFQRYFRIE